MLWYGAAVLAAVVIAFVLGAPASLVLIGLVVLVCPLMMLFMMGGGHGHGANDDDRDAHEHRDTSGHH